MAGTLQPLDSKFQIVDAEGRPTDYFTRWAQQRQEDIVAATTDDQVNALIADWAAARFINTAAPLTGGGSLAADLNFAHAASGVVAGSYTNANITVDAKGHVTAAANGSSGSTGTVTSVSVTTANGVSGVVANPTTTPAITITLGAITPTSVAASGNVTGANLSGTNTGDQTFSITGDGTAAGSTGILTLTVTKINGVSLAGLATGILKNTTATGLPSIAVAADFPTLNQNTSGSAATLTTARNFSIAGGGITAAAVSFDGSGAVALSASVDAGHITLARMANLVTNTLIGNNTGVGATPIALTAAQVKALLAIAAGDVSGLGYFATGTSAANLTGTLPTAQLPTLGGGLFVSGSTLYGPVQHPGYVSANWYHPIPGAAVGAGTALAANSIRLLPFTISKPITIAQLGVRITTLSALGNFQLAIYANNAATGKATGNALCSTANISTGATGTISAAASTTLNPGTYWMAINQDNAAAAYITLNQGNTVPGYLVGSSNIADLASNSTTSNGTMVVAQAFGTWPDLTSATFASNVSSAASALVFLKAA